MAAYLNRTIGSVIGIGLIVGILTWSDSSIMTSLASGAPASTPVAAPIAAPTNGFTEVAKQVTPAVVNITTVMTDKISERSSSPDELRDRMEESFGRPFDPRGKGPHTPRDYQGPRGGQGSGVIISSDGYILTNNHVIAKAREVNVTLPDKREFKGTIIGTDPKTDLAVVKIHATGLHAVPWGDATQLQVGEYVLAVGNPFGLNSTVTLEIVSAVGRGHMGLAQYEDFIQTDAAINPGNSGGALVNTKGELVGINTAIFSQSGGYQGVGFAVSTAMAKPIYESLVSTGKVIRGYIGVSIQDLTQDLAKSFSMTHSRGALISDVKEAGPAEQGGLKQGDVMIEYQGVPIEDGVVLQRLVTRTPIGTKVPVKVIRDGRERELTIRVGEQPDQAKVARVEAGESGFALAGLSVGDLDQEMARELGLKEKTQGVVVTRVEPDSGAGKTGLMPGDIIKEINRQPVKSIRDFEKLSSDVKKGDHILILIHRQGSSLFLSARI